MNLLPRRALTLALLVLGVWFYETMRPVPQPPGILAPDPPSVIPVTGKAAIFERNGHVLTAVAQFTAKARVLSIETYRRDREARIAPLDMVLGWGRMSDSTMLKMTDVAQTQRRVLFKSYDPGLPENEVEASIVNLHVVAADPGIEKRLGALRAGNIVQLQGWLVEAVSGDGWRWKGEVRERAPKMPGTLLWLQRIDAS